MSAAEQVRLRAAVRRATLLADRFRDTEDVDTAVGMHQIAELIKAVLDGHRSEA